MLISRNELLLRIGTVLFGLPLSVAIFSLTEKLFITDNGFCDEYRFPQLAFILDFFYEGYHYEATILNILSTFVLGFCLAYFFVKFLIKFHQQKA